MFTEEQLKLIHEVVLKRSGWRSGPGVLNPVAAEQIADAVEKDLSFPQLLARDIE